VHNIFILIVWSQTFLKLHNEKQQNITIYWWIDFSYPAIVKKVVFVKTLNFSYHETNHTVFGTWALAYQFCQKTLQIIMSNSEN